MAKRHNQRQRKKLRIGEFQELGFLVSAALRAPISDAERDALLDAFLESCIEANGMLFGGGINQDLDGFIVSSSARSSATEEQREGVRRWLAGRNEFDAVTVGPLVDAWRGHE